MFIEEVASRIGTALKAQPVVSLVSPEQIRPLYRRWRVQLMVVMIAGYAVFYFCRKNLSIAMPDLEEIGITKTKLGLVLSLTNFFYGLSKFVNGMVADNANPRYFLAIGLIASAMMNILFGAGSMYWTLAVAWLLNGWFQGMGWPPCARVLAHWYHVTERGTAWGIWNIAQQLGSGGIFILAGWLTSHYGWRSAFYVPAVIAMVTGVVIIVMMRDTPASVGLPSIEDYHDLKKGIVSGDKNPTSNVRPEGEETFKEILFKYVLKNRFLWLVCCANFFIYIVRLGVVDWIPMYLMQAKGSSKVSAGLEVTGFEVAGIFGALTAGWLSDKVFKTNRGKVNVIFTAAVAIIFYLFWFADSGSFFAITGLALLGFFIYGPQILVSVAAVDISTKRTAATSTGLTGLFGYMGASLVAGIGSGYIIEKTGWTGGFYLFIGSAIIATALFILTWRVRAVQ